MGIAPPGERDTWRSLQLESGIFVNRSFWRVGYLGIAPPEERDIMKSLLLESRIFGGRSSWRAGYLAITPAGEQDIWGSLHLESGIFGNRSTWTVGYLGIAPPGERHTQQTTAGHPHCLHAGVGVAGPAGCVVPRGRRHELLLLWGPSFLH